MRQEDEATTMNRSDDGAQPQGRRPYHTPLLRKLGPMQDVVQAKGGPGGDVSSYLS